MHQTSKKWEMPENNSSTRIIVQKGKLNWAGTCFWNIYKRMQVGTLVLWHLLKWSYQFSTAVCVDPGSCSGQWISLFGYSCSHKSQLPPLFELQFWSFVVLPGDVRFYTNSYRLFFGETGRIPILVPDPKPMPSVACFECCWCYKLRGFIFDVASS